MTKKCVKLSDLDEVRVNEKVDEEGNYSAVLKFYDSNNNAVLRLDLTEAQCISMERVFHKVNKVFMDHRTPPEYTIIDN